MAKVHERLERAKEIAQADVTKLEAEEEHAKKEEME